MLKRRGFHVVVALSAGPEAVSDAADRRWLARARWRAAEPGEDLLERVLAVLDLPRPGGGIGALRLWGQTGERPAGWVAAADPVYLEARMDHVRLHALAESELPSADVQQVFELLQARLGQEASRSSFAFTHIGAMGYLRSAEPMATAEVSPASADGASPDVFLPEGASARVHDRLQSEVQMCLHESPLNGRREEAGRPPVNALWFWGGGTAPLPIERSVPAMFGDDPVLRGYWRSSTGRTESWPGSLSACLESAGGGFVAVVPKDDILASRLAEGRGMLSAGRLRRLTLMFRGGLSAELRRGDRFRFWRRATLPATRP